MENNANSQNQEIRGNSSNTEISRPSTPVGQNIPTQDVAPSQEAAHAAAKRINPKYYPKYLDLNK